MKPFFLFLAVFAVSLLLVGILPHVLRGQILSVRPSGFPPARPAVVAASTSAMLDQGPIPQAGPALGVASSAAVVRDLPMLPELAEFTARVTTGEAEVVTGVYVEGLFALPIIQQPAGRPEYVSSDMDVVTQFALPTRHGSTGLLAHNYLSGRKFFELSVGQDVTLIYGDGRQETYRIERIDQFQALDSTSPFSRFIDPADASRQVLSSADLFNRVYTTPGNLVFQTCIEAFGDSSWGRMFVTATPVNQVTNAMPQVGQYISNN